MRAETGGEGASGACYCMFLTLGCICWWMKKMRKKNGGNGRKKQENIWRFKYARRRRPRWVMCICDWVEDKPALQIPTGLRRGDCVMPSQVSGRCFPVWRCTGIPDLEQGHRVTTYPQDTITVFSQVLQAIDESSSLDEHREATHWLCVLCTCVCACGCLHM